MSLKNGIDDDEPPTRDLKKPALPTAHLTLITGRGRGAKTDLDALDEAYTNALTDPDEPSAA